MARYTVVTFQCPRCRADLGRQFGLITSRSIPCPKCGTTVRIDGQVVAQNWGYNFAWVGGLLIWLALGAGVMLDPPFAASIGGKTFKSDTQQQRLVIALSCVIPGMLGGLVLGGIGMLLGLVMVGEGEAPPAPELLGSPGMSPEPQGRGCLVRLIFIGFWPVFVFIAAAIVLTAASGAMSAENKEVAEQLNKQSAEKYAMWVFLGSVLTFLLGCFGVLPWTGSGKKKSAPPPPSPGIDPRIFGR